MEFHRHVGRPLHLVVEILLLLLDRVAKVVDLDCGLLEFAALGGELVLGGVAGLLLLVYSLAEFLQRLVLLFQGGLNLGDHGVAGDL